jgi:hypothetical protein
MSKDPAVLFYTSDFISGTLTMSYEQKGKYIILLCLQHQQGKLSHDDMMNICGTYDEKVFAKFEKDEEGFYYNQRMRDEAEKRNKFTESRRQARLKCDEDNVRIYLLKDNDNGLIKIGSSVNPLRRYNEITNQTISVNGSSENRNYKLFWYSEPTIRKIETELHNLFKNNRFEGEWFTLTDLDISKIKSMVEKTYVQRTENINENININKNELDKLNKDYGEEVTKKAIQYLSDYKIEKNYKTKSDYLTLKRWVFDAVKERENKNANKGFSTYRNNKNDRQLDPDTAAEIDRIAESLRAK